MEAIDAAPIPPIMRDKAQMPPGGGFRGQ